MVLLSKISVDGFRNLERVTLEPHPRLNIFVGENGQGKTNFLEAIHMAGALRPMRKIARNRDLIHFQRDEASIQTIFQLDGPLPVDIKIEPTGRQARIAGKRVREVMDINRHLAVVSFIPEDLAMVRGSPQGRRRNLDAFAFSLDAAFARVAKTYDGLLERRNRLLKENWIDPQVLDAYASPLIEAGAELTMARFHLLERWCAPFQKAVKMISGGQMDAELGYMSAIEENDDLLTRGSTPRIEELRDSFARRLKESAERELVRRNTLVGPHLDDMIFYTGSHRARHFASQGEARALVLALRLSQVRIIAADRGVAPLVLLDDVAGELDPKRSECLFSLIDEVSAQTFVTVTHLEALPPHGPCSAYKMVNGAVLPHHEGSRQEEKCHVGAAAQKKE